METREHRNLKHAAVRFLRAAGCLAVGVEVRCPVSRYRVDVAGYLDRRPASRPRADRSWRFERCPPMTIMIECKQSRADFLRDSRRRDALIRERSNLLQMRESIERHVIERYEPELRRDGDTLFAELDRWDFLATQDHGYRTVIRKLRRIDRQIHGETKFHLATHWALADLLFLATPRGLVRPAEVPHGWGLLEYEPAEEQTDAIEMAQELQVRHPPARLGCTDRHRSILLRNIAVAASLAAHRTPIREETINLHAIHHAPTA